MRESPRAPRPSLPPSLPDSVGTPAGVPATLETAHYFRNCPLLGNCPLLCCHHDTPPVPPPHQRACARRAAQVALPAAHARARQEPALVPHGRAAHDAPAVPRRRLQVGFVRSFVRSRRDPRAPAPRLVTAPRRAPPAGRRCSSCRTTRAPPSGPSPAGPCASSKRRSASGTSTKLSRSCHEAVTADAAGGASGRGGGRGRLRGAAARGRLRQRRAPRGSVL